MEKNKWIYDIQACELINLARMGSIFKENNVAYSDGKFSIRFCDSKSNYYLQYETEKLRDSAFLHYINETNAKELDAKQKPLTL